MNAAWITFRKEIVDALRDRRTLAMVLVSSVLLGPLVLIALSALIASLEARAEQRVVYIDGIDHAGAMKNFFERQTYVVKTPPPGYEALLRESKFGDPVIVVAPDFEARLLRGEEPLVEVVSDSANKQADAGTRRVLRLIDAYARERSTLTLALRGVSPQLLQPLDVQERDLASTATRAAQFTAMLPFFVMMAVLYGALNAALDTTAGERERGSLEPLLMNPADRNALVVGKWAAAACMGMLIAVLSCLSFLPAQWLLRSDTLQAMFQFGLYEVLAFLAVLLPFAAALSAVLMAVAIRCRTFKEAQASSTLVVLLVSLMPLFTVFNQSGEEAWHLWVPALAQNTLMTRVLKGEALSALQVLLPLAVCVLLSVAGVVLVARGLRAAAVK
jgi:sodium transport system permease protein